MGKNRERKCSEYAESIGERNFQANKALAGQSLGLFRHPCGSKFCSSHTQRLQRLRRRQAGDRKERGTLTAEAAGSFPYRHQLNNAPDFGLHAECADNF